MMESNKNIKCRIIIDIDANYLDVAKPTQLINNFNEWFCGKEGLIRGSWDGDSGLFPLLYEQGHDYSDELRSNCKINISFQSEMQNKNSTIIKNKKFSWFKDDTE